MGRASRLATLVVAGATALGTGGALALATPAAAQGDSNTIYVSKQGDPSVSDGDSCDKPNYSALPKAVQAAKEGQTVKVCEGTYTPKKRDLNVKNDHVTIEAADSSKMPTIDFSHYAKKKKPFEITGNNATVRNLKLTKSDDYGIYASGVSGLAIGGNEFSDNGSYDVELPGATDKTTKSEPVPNKNVVVANNSFDVSNGTNAVEMMNVEHGNVASNDITGADDSIGLALDGGDTNFSVQGNEFDGTKYGVWLDHNVNQDPNTGIAVHANSFDGGVDYGVGLNGGARGEGGYGPAIKSGEQVDATNDYWGCSDGANGDGDDCVQARDVEHPFTDDEKPGDTDRVKTDDPLKAPLSGSASGTTINSGGSAEAQVHDSVAKTEGGTGTVTVSEFEGNPKGSIDDTEGKFFDVTTSRDSSFGKVSLGTQSKDASELHWNNGDKWQHVTDANETPYPGKGVSADIGKKSSPSLDDLHGTVFVGKKAEKPAPTGGPMASGPHYGVAGQTDLFTVDPDGNVTARWVKGSGDWKGPMPLADNASDGSKIATTKQYSMKHQTDAFYRGEDGKLHAAYNYGTGWKQATIPGTEVAKDSGIAASKHFGTKKQTDVFYQGEDGKLHAAYNYGKSWKDTVVGKKGEVQDGSDITASQHYGVKRPQTDVFYTGKDGQLSATYHNGKQWNTLEQVGKASDISSSGIAVAKNNKTGGTDVFYADADAKMQRMHAEPKGSGWNADQLKGTANGKAAIAATPHQTAKGQTDVFYVGEDGDLRAAYGNGSTWKDAAIPNAGSVQDSTDLSASQQFGIPSGQTDAFYTDGDGQTHVAYHDGKSWKNRPLS